MKPETRERKRIDKLVMQKLTAEGKNTELSDYRELIEKERSKKLSQVEESTLYYYRYSIKS